MTAVEAWGLGSMISPGRTEGDVAGLGGAEEFGTEETPGATEHAAEIRATQSTARQRATAVRRSVFCITASQRVMVVEPVQIGGLRELQRRHNAIGFEGPLAADTMHEADPCAR